MNILIISNPKNYHKLAPIIDTITSLGNQVYLPFGYDEKEIELQVTAFFSKDKTLVPVERIDEAFRNKKRKRTREFLALGGQYKVDQALFFNPDNELILWDGLEVMETVRSGVPTYLYHEDEKVGLFAKTCKLDPSLIRSLPLRKADNSKDNQNITKKKVR